MNLLPPFVFVTGNAGKLREAERLLGRPMAHATVDLVEIQSLDLRAVLEAKAEEAWRHLGKPLLVDDTSLELAALGGFPGPLIKWLLASIGTAGLCRLASSLGDPRATARCALLYCDGRRRVMAESIVEGEIVSHPAGEGGFGWDPAFRPAGEPGTYAELSDAVKDRIGHRGKAWRRLCAEFIEFSR